MVKRWGEKVRPLLVESFDVLGLQLKDIVEKKKNHKHQVSVKTQGGLPGAMPVELSDACLKNTVLS